VLAQAVPGPILTDTCGSDPSFVCRQVLEHTHSTWLAELADFLFAKPLAIAMVVVVAAAFSWVVRRAISRFVGAMVGEQAAGRKLRRRLRGSRVAVVIPSAALQTRQFSLRAAARAETLGAVLRSLASFVIWGLAAVTILGELGIDLRALIAGAGLAGVAIGFGAQSLVKDFLAGIFILVEDQYGVGDIVDVGDATGTVEEVTLRTTRIRDVNGTMWHVPNGQILRVANKSQQWARALLDLVVAHDTNVESAQTAIKATADAVWRDPKWSGQILEEPEVWGVEKIGPEGITIRLVVKTLPSRQFAIMRELRGRLKVALDDVGVVAATTAPTINVAPGVAPGVAPAEPAPAPVPAKTAAAKKSAPKRSG
jgi:small conductance mechanosensitive channel